jgi:hypothetical protein
MHVNFKMAYFLNPNHILLFAHCLLVQYLQYLGTLIDIIIIIIYNFSK